MSSGLVCDRERRHESVSLGCVDGFWTRQTPRRRHSSRYYRARTRRPVGTWKPVRCVCQPVLSHARGERSTASSEGPRRLARVDHSNPDATPRRAIRVGNWWILGMPRILSTDRQTPPGGVVNGRMRCADGAGQGPLAILGKPGSAARGRQPCVRGWPQRARAGAGQCRGRSGGRHPQGGKCRRKSPRECPRGPRQNSASIWAISSSLALARGAREKREPVGVAHEVMLEYATPR